MEDSVRARRVGDSIVITITKPILEETHITEGEKLALRTLVGGRILISKEGETVSAAKRLEMELAVLASRKEAIEAEEALALHEYQNSMPTAHPGIEDSSIMEGSIRTWTWEKRKIDVEIAEKRLQLFELTGEPKLPT